MKLPKFYLPVITTVAILTLAAAIIAGAAENYLVQALACFGGATIAALLYVKFELPVLRRRQEEGSSKPLNLKTAGLILLFTGVIFGAVSALLGLGGLGAGTIDFIREIAFVAALAGIMLLFGAKVFNSNS